MSNRVSIYICAFVDYSQPKSIIDTNYGYRICDDYAQEYNNNYESIGDVFDELNPEGILFWVETNHPDFHETVLHKNGLYLCDNWIDVWEQMTDDEHECYNPRERQLGTV